MSVSITETAPQIVQTPEQQLVPPEREAFLRDVLDGPYGSVHPGNYESALGLGLIDEFYYNPAAQEDGIAHILTGNVEETETGSFHPGGFHHEPSGVFGWPERAPSTVDRSHLHAKNSDERRQFSEVPFEPYTARVAIAGLTKIAMTKHLESGELIVKEANNSMFPKEYDGLGILRMVVNAKNNRDKSLDEVNHGGMIVGLGEVPMLDGKTPMKIRICMDQKSGKIFTAYPLVKAGGRMKLKGEAIEYYLYGDGVTQRVEKTAK